MIPRHPKSLRGSMTPTAHAFTVAEPFLLSRMIGNRGSHRRQAQDGHVPAAIMYLYASVEVGVVVEA